MRIIFLMKYLIKKNEFQVIFDNLNRNNDFSFDGTNVVHDLFSGLEQYNLDNLDNLDEFNDLSNAFPDLRKNTDITILNRDQLRNLILVINCLCGDEYGGSYMDIFIIQNDIKINISENICKTK